MGWGRGASSTAVHDQADRVGVSFSVWYTSRSMHPMPVPQSRAQLIDQGKKKVGYRSWERDFCGLHEHWHIDVAHLNVDGTFNCLRIVLDGFSPLILYCEGRESIPEADRECLFERARESVARARPRIISDNGPQFISRAFKPYIRERGMTRVRTAPCYPQFNGKLERVNKAVKSEALRRSDRASLHDAGRVVGTVVDHYNNARLHSAVG